MSEPAWAYPPGDGFVHRNAYTPDAIVWEHETTGERIVQTSRDGYHREGIVPPEAVDALGARADHVAAVALGIADTARERSNMAWDETEGLRLLVHALAALSGLALTFSVAVLVVLLVR